MYVYVRLPGQGVDSAARFSVRSSQWFSHKASISSVGGSRSESFRDGKGEVDFIHSFFRSSIHSLTDQPVLLQLQGIAKSMIASFLCVSMQRKWWLGLWIPWCWMDDAFSMAYYQHLLQYQCFTLSPYLNSHTLASVQSMHVPDVRQFSVWNRLFVGLLRWIIYLITEID